MTAFYSVETPQFFREIELPDNKEQWTEQQRQQYEQLKDAAEIHRTYVSKTSFRRG